eukprot:CAMPEP_0194333546 /NCGR_PEP_ID=MMETSP0171-20130528/63064_1 /TAXON_ID=218684 /ORGANISM="Corethron pennatum, Strain L29A3" /LENGTH=33 /DNA_ID= /DNA_START= /DNA_END= /DNA_ORIENTATION=
MHEGIYVKLMHIQHLFDPRRGAAKFLSVVPVVD